VNAQDRERRKLRRIDHKIGKPCPEALRQERERDLHAWPPVSEMTAHVSNGVDKSCAADR
jgi:hypothetical protein